MKGVMDEFTKLASKILYESDLVVDCHQVSGLLYLYRW